MDRYFLKLSWKNIWRNRRRTLLTINAIGFGVMALVALYNYYDGFHDQVIQNVIRYQSGHLLVTAPDYHKRMATQLFMKDPSEVDTWLSSREEVKAFSHRVMVQGLVSTAQGSANIVFAGIEPEREKDVTRFSGNLIQGTYFNDDTEKPIVLGSELANLLQASLGSKVVALTQGVDGSIGNELFYVSGIFETHSDFDKNMAFVHINDARQLLSLGSQASHQLAVVLKNEEGLESVQQSFVSKFGSGPNLPFQILNWKEVQKPLMAMIELNQSANRLLMFIIIFVAALGIANSILMSILERTREFGVMLAIGTTKKEVVKMVVMETVLLSLVGVALGNVLGFLVTEFFHHYGFDLAWLSSQKLVVQGTIIQTISYPEIRWNNSLLVSLIVLVLSLVVSFIPIKHVSRLNPVNALRAL
ncbi:MAG: ABC transporter permease [Proteobacteria bacterium]|nr:ABC transporter permease [Pseudomonadota bacterium]NDC23283.1 ABC transporter permease [Pseudomonadota bacterium]NDD04413.1 ABC transporter permease [Pseudomonadota bacterium]NDG26175.1 ABC transporter permease [Pseudomonadota bacterium]